MNSIKWIFDPRMFKAELIPFILILIVIIFILVFSFILVRIELKNNKKIEKRRMNEKKN